LACALVLALRLRVLEPFFGGLDKMYQAHKVSALAGFVLVLLHFLTKALTEQLQARGIARSQIHYEEFNFR
jgi:predicted ferric reductase